MVGSQKKKKKNLRSQTLKNIYIYIYSWDNTYKAPPPAGPAALNRDMADIDIPFAAPLWLWLFIHQYQTGI